MKKGRDGSNELQPKKEEHRPTVSIALPGSIIDNAQSLELATRLASQVARGATIFRINEVVVFDFDSKDTPGNGTADGVRDGVDDHESGAAFLIRILRYLETPHYLRKALFPKHHVMCYVVSLESSLKQFSYSALLRPIKDIEGVLPPLDAPRHLRMHEWATYREEESMEEDGGLKGKTVQDFFDVCLNTCPHQGSRTIRTGEAILMSLQFFQQSLERSQNGVDK